MSSSTPHPQLDMLIRNAQTKAESLGIPATDFWCDVEPKSLDWMFDETTPESAAAKKQLKEHIASAREQRTHKQQAATTIFLLSFLGCAAVYLGLFLWL